jgi:hypothetical protein
MVKPASFPSRYWSILAETSSAARYQQFPTRADTSCISETTCNPFNAVYFLIYIARTKPGAQSVINDVLVYSSTLIQHEFNVLLHLLQQPLATT